MLLLVKFTIKSKHERASLRAPSAFSAITCKASGSDFTPSLLAIFSKCATMSGMDIL